MSPQTPPSVFSGATVGSAEGLRPSATAASARGAFNKILKSLFFQRSASGLSADPIRSGVRGGQG
ncbi:hypothetical protein HMPREF9946_05214, partial [Acetobacteraceae bacterium AT-5844]